MNVPGVGMVCAASAANAMTNERRRCRCPRSPPSAHSKKQPTSPQSKIEASSFLNVTLHILLSLFFPLVHFLPPSLPSYYPQPTPHPLTAFLPHDGAPGKTNRECTTAAGVPACSSIAATLFTSLYSDVSVGEPASPNCANVSSLRLLSLPTHSCPNR